MQLYLDACFEEDEGDGKLIAHALGDIARALGLRLMSAGDSPVH